MKTKLKLLTVAALALFFTSCTTTTTTCTDSCPKVVNGICSGEDEIGLNPTGAAAVLAKANVMTSLFSGTLIQYPVTDPSQGYVYLKVDDGFIHDLFPLGQFPAGFIPDPNPIGAHISVFSGSEMLKIDPKNTQLPEDGQNFQFTPCCLASWKGKASDWIVLQVQSPDLMCLLTKYGIPTQGVTLHISIAQKVLSQPSK
jgi:hypothetical protein